MSRNTLREAVAHLVNQGVLIKRRGIGTFVASRPVLANTLNVNSGITEMILAAGGVPGSAEAEIRVVPADDRMARLLEVLPQSAITVLERVRTMDARRISLSVHYYSQERVSQRAGRATPDEEIARILRERNSIYAFLSEDLGVEIDHSIAWIRPLIAGDSLGSRLAVAADTPILYLEQVDYSVGGEPMILIDEYCIADSFAFTVYRSS